MVIAPKGDIYALRVAYIVLGNSPYKQIMGHHVFSVGVTGALPASPPCVSLVEPSCKGVMEPYFLLGEGLGEKGVEGGMGAEGPGRRGEGQVEDREGGGGGGGARSSRRTVCAPRSITRSQHNTSSVITQSQLNITQSRIVHASPMANGTQPHIVPWGGSSCFMNRG